jgi:hypothetical protein
VNGPSTTDGNSKRNSGNGQKIPLHFHDRDQFVYASSGVMTKHFRQFGCAEISLATMAYNIKRITNVLDYRA